jgi:hypothetical protein
MKSIGEATFRYCYELKNITIPNGVTSIGKAAFHACEALKSINIPESVTNIGDYAFFGTGLTSITIPKGVTDIGYQSIGYFYNGSGNAVKEGFTIKGCKDSAAETYARENNIKFIALDGDIKHGDLNDDGIIDVDDLVLMQKLVAGWKVSVNEINADIDGDGDSDIDDLVLMQKLAAGWKI